MARVQYGSIITAMRGSIGGTTFSAAGGLSVAKQRARPPKPITPAQVLSKDSVRRLSPTWKNLTNTQRFNWGLQGISQPRTNSLGQNYFPGPFATFSMYALFGNSRGLSQTPTLPSALGYPSVPAVTLNWNSPDLEISAIAPAPAAGVVFGVSVYSPTPQSWASFRGKVFSTANGNGNTLPWVIATDYADQFAAGSLMRAWVQFRFMDTSGRLSQLVTQSLDFTV